MKCLLSNIAGDLRNHFLLMISAQLKRDLVELFYILINGAWSVCAEGYFDRGLCIDRGTSPRSVQRQRAKYPSHRPTKLG